MFCEFGWILNAEGKAPVYNNEIMQRGSEESKSDASTSDSEPRSNSTKPRKHLLNLTLAGLPELEQFDSEEQRQKALQQIGREAAKVRSWSYWLAVLILAGAAIAAAALARFLLSRVAWPRILEAAIYWLAIGVTFGLVLRRLHRAGTPEQLRQKLLQSGVPVCLACGYLLRGLPTATNRCPECGTALSDEVRAIRVPEPLRRAGRTENEPDQPAAGS